MPGGIEGFGQEIAKHAGLSQRDYAQIFERVAAVAAAIDGGLWNAQKLQELSQGLDGHLQSVVRDCAMAYEGRGAERTGIEAFGRELANHSALNHGDCARLLEAMSLVAKMLDLDMWDQRQRQIIIQKLPLPLWDAFRKWLQAYGCGQGNQE